MPDRGGDSRRADDWFEFAMEDVSAMHALGPRHLRQASFFMQQAAEKALKGFLLARGQPLRFTHDLELLLADAMAFDSALSK